MRRETATRVKPVCSVAAVAMAPPWGAQLRMIASLMSSICTAIRTFKDFYCISRVFLLSINGVNSRF
jgi:hypothetical protein